MAWQPPGGAANSAGCATRPAGPECAPGAGIWLGVVARAPWPVAGTFRGGEWLRSYMLPPPFTGGGRGGAGGAGTEQAPPRTPTGDVAGVSASVGASIADAVRDVDSAERARPSPGRGGGRGMSMSTSSMPTSSSPRTVGVSDASTANTGPTLAFGDVGSCMEHNGLLATKAPVSVKNLSALATKLLAPVGSASAARPSQDLPSSGSEAPFMPAAAAFCHRVRLSLRLRSRLVASRLRLRLRLRL